MSAPASMPASMSLSGQALGHLARAGIAEAAGPQRDALLAGELLDAAIVEQVAVGVVEVERDRAAAHRRGGRAVDAHHVPAVAVPQREQLVRAASR